MSPIALLEGVAGACWLYSWVLPPLLKQGAFYVKILETELGVDSVSANVNLVELERENVRKREEGCNKN